MRKKGIVVALSLVAVAALLIKGKGLLHDRQAKIADAPTPVANKVWVKTVKGEEGRLSQQRTLLAELKSQKQISLSTKIPGYIESVQVEEAQEVKKGDLLVHIDAFELRSNLQALQKTLIAQQNDLALAQSIYKRNKKLYSVGGLSKEKFMASKVAMGMKSSIVENTKEKIAQLKHQQRYLDIKAPFDGVIDQIHLHKGDFALTGKPIVTMSDKSQKLLFRYSLDPSSPIAKGEAVYSQGKRIGKVKSLYPVAQEGLRVAEVELEVPLEAPVGSSVPISVVTKEAKGCILPDTVLLHKKEGTFVMLHRDGRFFPKKVTPLILSQNRILLQTCPASPVASATESRLSTLPALRGVGTTGASDAK